MHVYFKTKCITVVKLPGKLNVKQYNSPFIQKKLKIHFTINPISDKLPIPYLKPRWQRADSLTYYFSPKNSSTL